MAHNIGSIPSPFSPTTKRRKRRPFEAGIPDISVRPGANGPRGGQAQPGRSPLFTTEITGATQPVLSTREIIEQQRAQLLGRQAQEFNPLRQSFRSTLGTELALSQQGAQARQAQRSARAGLAFSGAGEAGAQFVEAAGQIQFARTLGEFETQILSLQQQERAAFDAGAFDFTRNIFALGVQQEFQLQIERFRANVAKDIASQQTFGAIFQGFGSLIGLGAGFLIGGPVGAAAGSQIGSSLTSGEATGSGVV